MRPRVCIFAEATPFTWVGHYVRAFRRCCDVFTIGPAPTAEDLARWGLTHLADRVMPNDVTCDLGQLRDPERLLPEGWAPDLAVAIASNGRPACTQAHRLGCPTAFLSIDTWQCLVDFEHARHYDLVFVAQREFVQPMRDLGAGHAAWLPLAADPRAHHPVDAAPAHDLVFVGHADAVAHRERAALLERLGGELDCVREARVFGEDYCRAMARGRLAFNRSAMEDLNMRVFEALAMGHCLLTDRQAARNGLLDLFEEDHHLAAYADGDELLQRARELLADPERRGAIAEAGRAEVLARHTYGHRVQAILDAAGALPPRDPRAARGMLALLPRRPGRVVDLGMRSGATRHALARLGAADFSGVGEGAPAARYDAVHPWPGEGLAADTVLVGDLDALPDPVDAALCRAHALLPPGGALLLAGTGLPDGPEALTAWLRARDFHLVRGHGGSGGTVLLARKRTRRLRAVLLDFEARFSVREGAYAPGGLDGLPEDA